MKAIIGSKTYAVLRNVRFSPQSDFTSATMPVNEFSFEAKTDDVIRANAWCKLVDDLGQVWARYRVRLVEDLGRGFQRVTARSSLGLLDLKKMEPAYYSGKNAGELLGVLLSQVGTDNYEVDSSLSAKTVTGYCPEQTRRERLQWVLMAIGGYALDAFSDKLRILKFAENEVTVPMGETYWRPSKEYRDVVTALTARQYHFRAGEPQGGDDSVTVDGTTYIVTSEDITLSNPLATSADPENVVSVSDVMLIGSGNVDDVLTLLSKRWFDREEIVFECINDRAYKPVDKLSVAVSDDEMSAGYAESLDFTFGVRAKSKVRLVGASDVEAAGLTVIYKYGKTQLGKKRYLLPVGVAYEIDNPFITWQMNKHRYVFRPKALKVSGTVPAGGETKTVQYAVALDLHKKALHVVSVDSVELVEQEKTVDGQTVTINVAVIS